MRATIWIGWSLRGTSGFTCTRRGGSPASRDCRFGSGCLQGWHFYLLPVFFEECGDPPCLCGPLLSGLLSSSAHRFEVVHVQPERSRPAHAVGHLQVDLQAVSTKEINQVRVSRHTESQSPRGFSSLSSSPSSAPPSRASPIHRHPGPSVSPSQQRGRGGEENGVSRGHWFLPPSRPPIPTLLYSASSRGSTPVSHRRRQQQRSRGTATARGSRCRC
mmetsp:Transcript_34995/g.69077  ORF Transcript_34995/g.69077 Transcript_34995/m.69077 type:complete len:217 (-) Transcript_34995:1015-1665(-)